MSDDPDTAIRRLDRATVERIAAGEVVERPASVVKELVENSLDADASRVEITVEGDGTDRLRVRDDGRGMSEADVRAAVREHTTSKIDDIDDLEAGVATLGFRGEALHTIGAVSRMEITTRPRGSEGAGTRLRYEGGEVTAVEPAGCPEGTTVEVADLFFNTPARRKYLKTAATEFGHVNRIASRYALANPDVAVELTHDARETFATTGQGDLRATLLSVYGREVAESMIPLVAGDAEPAATDLDGSDAADLPEGPLEGVWGYVSHPETTRSTREYCSTFVNGRYVDASAARDAVLDGYGGQLAADRYPFVVLFLSADPGTVDVNVHPRKMEVRFEDSEGVRDQVRTVVRDALLDHGLVRSSAPRGRSAPEEASVAPDSAGRGTEAPDSDPDAPRGDPETTEGGSVARTGGSETPDPSGTDPDAPGPGSPESGTAAADPGRAAGSDSGEGGSATSTTASAGSTGTERGTGTDHGAGPDRGTDARSGADDSGPGSGREDDGAHGSTARFGGATEQRTLNGEAATDDREYDRLPRMRVLGQLAETYVVAETPDGLVLVDQHAADERINYERLGEAFEGDTTAQSLAAPVEIDLTAGEAATFRAVRDALARLGFHAELREADDGHALAVSTVPAVFDETLDPDDLRDVLEAVIAGEQAADTVDAIAEEFLADLACYPSVTAGTSLREGSVLELLAALDDCENPFACPHGRPVLVEIDREEIDARFERDYPGHGGRREP